MIRFILLSLSYPKCAYAAASAVALIKSFPGPQSRFTPGADTEPAYYDL